MNNKLAIGVIAGLGIIIIVLSVALVMVTRQSANETAVSNSSPTPVQTKDVPTTQIDTQQTDNLQTVDTTDKGTCVQMGQSELRVSTNGVGIATVIHRGDTSKPVEARIYGSDNTNMKQLDTRTIPAGSDTIEFDVTVEPWMTHVAAVSCTDATPGSGILIDRSITTEITPNQSTRSYDRDADDDVAMCLGDTTYMAERDATCGSDTDCLSKKNMERIQFCEAQYRN